jgi:hypothetical protein
MDYRQSPEISTNALKRARNFTPNICVLGNFSAVPIVSSLKLDRLHDLRHTAASIGVTVGMSLPVIGRLLGHTQAQTTQRYAHVAIDPAISAADRISDHIHDAMLGAGGTGTKVGC